MVGTRQASRQGRAASHPPESSLPYTLVHSVPPEVSVNGTKVDSKGLHLSLTIPLNSPTAAAPNSRRSTSKKAGHSTQSALSPPRSQHGGRTRSKVHRSPRHNIIDQNSATRGQDNALGVIGSQGSTVPLREAVAEPSSTESAEPQRINEGGHFLRRRVRAPRCGVRGCMDDGVAAQVNASPKHRTAALQVNDTVEGAKVADLQASRRSGMLAEVDMNRQVDLRMIEQLHIDELLQQQRILQRQQWQLQNQQLLHQQQQIHQQHWLQMRQGQMEPSDGHHEEHLSETRQLDQQHQLQLQIVQQQLQQLLQQSREIQEQQRQLQQLHNRSSPSTKDGGQTVDLGKALTNGNTESLPVAQLEKSLNSPSHPVVGQFDDTHKDLLASQATFSSDKCSNLDSMESVITYGGSDEAEFGHSSSSLQLVNNRPSVRILDSTLLHILSFLRKPACQFQVLCKRASLLLLAAAITAGCIVALLVLGSSTSLAFEGIRNGMLLNLTIESGHTKELSPWVEPASSHGRFFFPPNSSRGINSIQEQLELFSKCSTVEESQCGETLGVLSEGEFACSNDGRLPMCVNLKTDIAAQDRGGRVDYRTTTGAPSPGSITVSWILEKFASSFMPAAITLKSSASTDVFDDETAALLLGSYFPYYNHLNDPTNLLSREERAYSFAESKGQVTLVLPKLSYIYAVTIDAPAALADGRCPGAEPLHFSVHIQGNGSTSINGSAFGFLNPFEKSHRTLTDAGNVDEWTEVGKFRFGCDIKPSIQVFFLLPRGRQVVQTSIAHIERMSNAKELTQQPEVSACTQTSCWKARLVRFMFTSNWGSAVTLVRKIRILSCEGPGNPCEGQVAF